MSVAENDGFVSIMPDNGSFLPDDLFDVEMSQERLLLQNNRFTEDIEKIRNKYDIKVDVQGDYSETAYMDYISNPPKLTKSKKFNDDISLIVQSIELPGDWHKSITDYIFGIDNIGLGVFEYEKNAIGRLVEGDSGKYVEIRFYGNLTTPELRKIVSSDGVRRLIKDTLPHKKPYKKSDEIGFRIHQLRKTGMTYEDIWKQLAKEKHKYEDYHYVHKLHNRFKKKVDKLYAQNLPIN